VKILQKISIDAGEKLKKILEKVLEEHSDILQNPNNLVELLHGSGIDRREAAGLKVAFIKCRVNVSCQQA
jgi:predicted DNA-binding antitoxin AbrB/MazE fold protein